MALIEINWKPSSRDLRQFAGIWFPAFFVLVGTLIWYRAQTLTVPVVLAAIAVVVAVVGLVRPSAIRPLFHAWMVAVYPVGWLTSHLLLGIVYFLIITPIGAVLRLCGYDPMERSFDRSRKTYWVPHNPSAKAARYFRQI
jgi:hypothetical protein